MPEAMTIGVDIGGTKVAAGLVDSSGGITHKTRAPMVATGDAATGFAAVKEAVDAVFSEFPEARAAVTGIGICAPGPLDPNTGVVLNPPNLPCWRDFPLAAEVERVFGVPARVDNDANAAGLAEALWGAAVGYTNVFYATIGTGIGTGIVFDRKIYHGRTGSAAEGGHMTIDFHGHRCGCGKRGCIEALASGPNIARRARAKLRGGGKSRIVELAGSLEQVRAEYASGFHLDWLDPLGFENSFAMTIRGQDARARRRVHQPVHQAEPGHGVLGIAHAVRIRRLNLGAGELVR